MDFQQLKWTKNIRPLDNEFWAYEKFGAGCLFKLAWKNDKANASKPHKGDFILLRQKGYVTHLVKVLDNEPGCDSWHGEYNIYRIVEVLWAIDWNNLPAFAKADKMFDYSAVLSYQGGDVMKLAIMPTFKRRWNNDGGLEAFQERVFAMLNLA